MCRGPYCLPAGGTCNPPLCRFSVVLWYYPAFLADYDAFTPPIWEMWDILSGQRRRSTARIGTMTSVLSGQTLFREAKH